LFTVAVCASALPLASIAIAAGTKILRIHRPTMPRTWLSITTMLTAIAARVRHGGTRNKSGVTE
jgi:hypothetical protein